MPARVRIRDLPGRVGQQTHLCGWVTHRRVQGKICFLVVRDGTGVCQLVASVKDVPPETFAAMERAGQESSFRAAGVVRAERRAPGDAADEVA